MACLFVQQLTVIDCAFLDAARGLVGESWIVDLELEGDLDDQSMVLDFGEVKKRLKKAIDGAADHKLVVPMNSQALQLNRAGGRIELFFSAKTGPIEHQSPSAALCQLESADVDADALAAHLMPFV